MEQKSPPAKSRRHGVEYPSPVTAGKPSVCFVPQHLRLLEELHQSDTARVQALEETKAIERAWRGTARDLEQVERHLQAEIDSRQQEHAAHLKKTKSLVSSKKDLRNDKHALQEIITAQEATITQLQLEVQRVQRQFTSSHSQRDSKQLERKKLQFEHEEAARDVSADKEKKAQMKLANATAKKIKQLERDHADASALITDMKVQRSNMLR
jgi:hypothetical protein